MKKYLSLTITMMFGVIVSIGMAGCGAKGNQFSGFNHPPQNEGIVYIYRPSSFVGNGVKYTVYDVTNENVIGTLRNGGYIRYQTKPGKITISILHDSHGAVLSANIALLLISPGPLIDPDGLHPSVYSINIRKNDITCIRWDAAGERRVTNGLVDKSTCRKEIVKTKLSYK